LVEFAVNGAKVENEAEFVNPLWKQFYADGKRWEDGEEVLGENTESLLSVSLDPQPPEPPLVQPIEMKPTRRRPKVAPQPVSIPLESEEFDFIVRTQLTTSRNKQDVYFAKNREGQLKVVKGPYRDMTDIDILKQNTDWKIKHGLPHIPYEVKEMIPDRWSKGTPLGIRNSLDRTVKAYFIVFDSVIFEEQIKTRKHSSKIWPETEVVDWEKIPLHFDYKGRELLEQEMIDYVHNILYRYLLGISDLADRNFLMISGRIISIDEEIKDRLDGVNIELRKNKCIFIQNWLKDNYEKLDVSSWTLNEPITRLKQLKLEEIKNKEFCLRLFKPY
jgi:hypothetical protein